MSSYGFGYDDELPAGYQDADLEMRELEELADEEPAPDVLELDTGQLALSSRVEARGGQLVIEAAAAPAKPAPVTFERDAIEQAAREQLEELAQHMLADAIEEAGLRPLEFVDDVEPARATPGSRFKCAYCGAELEPEHYVYSRHTGRRYCWPGEGCNVTRKER